MSAGPIKQDRDAHRVPRVSVPDKGRVCAAQQGRGYCGRRRGVTLAKRWELVTCTDCRAAYRADGGRIDFLHPSVAARI